MLVKEAQGDKWMEGWVVYLRDSLDSYLLQVVSSHRKHVLAKYP